MQTILVPLDESPAAEAALPVAAALARAAGAGLLLMRVTDRPPVGVRPFEVRGGAISYAEEYLAGVADRLDIDARTEVLAEGPVPQGILDSVSQREPWLVALATHGRSGLGRWVYGATTNAVLARCPVPVLLARSWLSGFEAASIEKGALVLCPLDGSSYAEAAFPIAEGLASSLAGRLEKIQVDAPAGRTILAAAAERGAGLIVMSAHGQSAPGRALLGSVADYVLRMGTVPLVLLGPAAVASR